MGNSINTIPSNSPAATSTATPVPVVNENSPLLKVVFVSKILCFCQQETSSSSVFSSATIASHQNHQPIHKFIALSNVNTTWNETVIFYKKFSCESICHFCDNLTHFVRGRHNKSEQHATLARDLLIWLSKFVRHENCVASWTNAVYWIISDNKEVNRKLFGIEEIRDAFQKNSEFATSATATYPWCRAIEELILTNDFNKKLFCMAEICECFVFIAQQQPFLSSSKSVYRWCACLCSLTEPLTSDDDENHKQQQQKVFFTENLRDSLICVSKLFANEETNYFIQLVHNLVYDKNNNSKRRNLFAVEGIRNALFVTLKHIDRCWSVYYFARSVVSLCEINPKLFSVCCNETLKILIRVASSLPTGNYGYRNFTHSRESIYWILLAIKTMLEIIFEENKKNQKIVIDDPEKICQVVSQMKKLMNNGVDDDDDDNNDNEEEEKLLLLLDFKHVYSPEAVKRASTRSRDALGYLKFDEAELKRVNNEYLENSQKLVFEIEKMFS